MTDKRQKKLMLPADVCRRFEEVADREGVYQSELMSELITDIYGVDEDAPEYLRRQKSELQDREEEIINEISELETELSEIEEQKAEITDRISELEAKQREFDEIITDILTDMQAHPDKSILAYRSEISEACRSQFGGITDSNRQEVIEKLRTRAEEHDEIDIEPYRFQRASMAAGADASASTSPSDDASGVQFQALQSRGSGTSSGVEAGSNPNSDSSTNTRPGSGGAGGDD